MALASCAGSRFRETNHEFVQSNKCERVTFYEVRCEACGERWPSVAPPPAVVRALDGGPIVLPKMEVPRG